MSFDVHDLLWDTVGGEHEAVRKTSSLVHGKVAVAGYWPLLSSATSEKDFSNRLAMVSDKISAVVDPSVYDDVVSSLRDDFRTLHEASKKEATNYQPDPNAEWRYHPGYEQLRQPVNNGDLQDTDGFVMDLAQDEDRSNPRIEFQTTPGVWTSHDGMPERPMPFSQERGYRPVNASLRYDADGFVVEADREDFPGWAASYWDMGARHATNGQSPQMHKMPDWQHNAYKDGYMHGGYAGQHREMRDAAHNGQFDKDGFLVRAYSGRGVDQLADNTNAAPQRVNPYYFNEGAAMGANDGFPENPSENEGVANRSSEYGDVAPQTSAGSDLSTSDGKGYSRSHPGESPNFSSTAQQAKGKCSNCDGTGTLSKGERSERDCPVCGGSGWTNKTAGRHSAPEAGDDYPTPHEVDRLLVQHRLPITRMERQDHGLAHGLLGLDPRDRHSREYMDAYNRGADRSRVANYKYVKQQGDKWVVTQKGTGKVLSHHDSQEDAEASFRAMMESKHGSYFDRAKPTHWHHDDGEKAYDLGYDHGHAGRPPKFTGHEDYLMGHRDGQSDRQVENVMGYPSSKVMASTDGKIVDHCPGCDKPRRNHDTPHGTETRHIHNDHVRCHGAKTAGVEELAEGAEAGGEGGEGGGGELPQLPHSKAPETWSWNMEDQKTGSVDTVMDQKQPEPSATPDQGVQLGQPDEDPSMSTTAQFFDPFVAASWGLNRADHDRSLSFQEGVEYSRANYGTHIPSGMSPLDYFRSLAGLESRQLSNGSVHTAGDYLGRPDARNPTGRGEDEYQARNWDAFSRQRPMQTPEDRNVNTPVKPEPLVTNNGRPGLRDNEPERDQEEEDDEE